MGKAFLAILFAAVTTAGAALAAEQATNARVGVAGPENGPGARMAAALAEAVAEATHGAVVVSVVAFPEADDGSAVYDALVGGSVDLAFVEDWVLGTRNPALSLLAKPYVFLDNSRARTFFLGDGGRRVASVVSPRGVRILGWFDTPHPGILSDRVLAGPEDFADLRLALSNNPLLVAAFNGLGAVAVAMPNQERRLEALRAGTVDAIELFPAKSAPESYPASAKNVTEMEYGPSFTALCASNAFWARLPDKARADLEAGIDNVTVSAASVSQVEHTESAGFLLDGEFNFAGVNRGEFRDRFLESQAAVTQGADPELQSLADEANADIIIQ